MEGVPSDLRAQLPASFAQPTQAAAAAAPRMGHPEAISNHTTHFLALDKCLPSRKFLQILEVDTISKSSSIAKKLPYRFTYDKEWLAITRAFASINPLTSPIPPDGGESYYQTLIKTEESWVEKNLVGANKMVIPDNFELTAPIYDPGVGLHPREHPKEYTNPQTVAFCKLLEIENFFDYSEEDREQMRLNAPSADSNSSGGRRGGGGRGRGRGRGYGGRSGGPRGRDHR
ncbi:MAG: hypothetical protein Q9192_008564 [Flavoplaca navasiana]